MLIEQRIARINTLSIDALKRLIGDVISDAQRLKDESYAVGLSEVVCSNIQDKLDTRSRQLNVIYTRIQCMIK